MIHAGQDVAAPNRICQAVAETLPRVHYTGRPLDEEIARDALRQYFDLLDRQHMVFLQSDLEEFSQRYGLAPDCIGMSSVMLQSLRRGDLTPAREIQSRYAQRFAERIASIGPWLKSSPDFGVEEYCVPDRRRAGWPRTVAEANELWRLRIKSEWLDELLAGRTVGETAAALSEAYERKVRLSRFDEGRLLHYYLSALAKAYDPHSAYYAVRGRAAGALRETATARNEGEVSDKRLLVGMVTQRETGKRHAVLRLSVFYRGCALEIKNVLSLAMEKGAEGIVLDLRGNQGGNIDEAVEAAGLFVGEGPVARYREREGRVRTLFSRNECACALPLVVLVDGETASAAEMLAAAMQDYRRAVIVGSGATFGKGTMQGVVPLESVIGGGIGDCGELKVTFRQFYRVTGAAVQGRGVEPDVLIPLFKGHDAREAELARTIAADAVQAVSIGVGMLDREWLERLRERSAQRLKQSDELELVNQLRRLTTRVEGDEPVSLRYESRRLDRERGLQLESELEQLPRAWNYEALTSGGGTVFARRDCTLDEASGVLRDLTEGKTRESFVATESTP